MGDLQDRHFVHLDVVLPIWVHQENSRDPISMPTHHQTFINDLKQARRAYPGDNGLEGVRARDCLGGVSKP